MKIPEYGSLVPRLLNGSPPNKIRDPPTPAPGRANAVATAAFTVGIFSVPLIRSTCQRVHSCTISLQFLSGKKFLNKTAAEKNIE